MKHFILVMCAMFGVAVLATQPVAAATSMDSHNTFEIYDDTGSGGGELPGGGGATVGQGDTTGSGGQAGAGGQTSTTGKATPSNLANRATGSQGGTGTGRMGIGSWLNQKTGDRLPALNGLSDFWVILFGIQLLVIVALSVAIIWQRRRVRLAVTTAK